jgi:hypothetical protein
MPSFFNTWLPFIYLYGVGGLFFYIGLILVKKAGSYDPTKKRHRYWWRILIFGFFYFMLIHAILIVVALYI